MRELNKNGIIRLTILCFSKVTFLILCLSLTGCSYYLLTESKLSMHDTIKAPQVIKTKSYSAIKDKVKTVSIIAPDLCRKQSALSANVQQNDFIRSSCGVEIGIIEKKLLAEGFNVISWEILQSMSKDNSFYQAGKELGIDILFAINSLENITADSSNVNIVRKYYKSDRDGSKGELWPLEEGHKKLVRMKLKEYEGDINDMSVGAAIDVTAIEVKTGKSIWYYQASFYNVEKQENKFTAAFQGKRRRLRIFQINGEPVRPRSPKRAKSSIEQDDKKANLRDDIFFEYLKFAVSSFITSFKTGR